MKSKKDEGTASAGAGEAVAQAGRTPEQQDRKTPRPRKRSERGAVAISRSKKTRPRATQGGWEAADHDQERERRPASREDLKARSAFHKAGAGEERGREQRRQGRAGGIMSEVEKADVLQDVGLGEKGTGERLF